MSDTEVNICPSASPVSRPCCSSWFTVSSTADWRVSTDALELLFHTLRNRQGVFFTLWLSSSFILHLLLFLTHWWVLENIPEWGWLCWPYHIHSSQSPQLTNCNCCSHLQEEGTEISPQLYHCSADVCLKDNKQIHLKTGFKKGFIRSATNEEAAFHYNISKH